MIFAKTLDNELLIWYNELIKLTHEHFKGSTEMVVVMIKEIIGV